MFGSRMGFSAELRFLRWGLHTSTAVARLPLRQLGFLVETGYLVAISGIYSC